MPVAGLRRVAHEQIERAIGRLSDEASDRHAAIHDARKHLKKVRAILRLLRPALPEIYEKENPIYRNLGRDLSPIRDATTLIESIDQLAEQTGGDARLDRLLAETRRALVARRQKIIDGLGNLDRRLKELVAQLRKAQERIEEWQAEDEGFETIEPALRRSYVQGRKQLKAALDEPTMENLHELRKRAKDHWYHARLLQNIWPRRLKEYQAALETLSDLLGNDHDLEILCRTLQAEPEGFGAKRSLQPLLKLAASRQDALRREAFALAGRIYAEKPKNLTKRFGKWWSIMREEA